ncbi:MAG: hypothetical protein LBB18_00970 [Puniceicoccales bacterium]|jgi:hypothetical protein|nr:hypothetical protein [Puniceicoccales bacterium]
MATYVTGKFSEFIGRDGFPEHWKRCTFVVPSYDDIWWLKEVFADSNVEIGGIEFFTADEFREHLCTVFSIGKMICAGSLVDFYFDEMASRVSDRGVVGNAIVASRQATLQAFFKILASGVRFDDLCNEESRRIFEDFRSEVSQNGCIFANDADRSLLKLAEASPLKFDESVVFYGFLPFDGAKVLMETAAKCYSRADAVSHDFGDAEFIHLWIGTLEKIFGESIFSHCGGGEGSVEFNAYETSYDEVEMTFRSIQRILAENSSARVGLCFDGDGSPQISMLRDRMDAAGIRYHDAIGRYRNPQNYSTLIALWADWQIKREAGPFCKFCADLVANNLLSREQFDGIIGNVFSLRTRCLSENYDVLLEFANVKNIDSFDAVERYDIHGARFSFENFYEKFAIAFDTILPQNILDALRKQLEFPHWKRIFCRSSLVKYFAKFTTIGIKDYAIGSNVVLIELDSAFKQNFTHIFVPGMTARRFEIPEDGFLIGADDIDAINASAIVVSTYGDLAIRRSRNFILSARSKRYLQGTIFEFFAKCEKMTLSYALKDYSSVETRQFPAKVFAETFCARSGEFYSAELEKKLLVMGPPPARNLEAETEKNIEDCAASYAIRHDLSVSLHD